MDSIVLAGMTSTRPRGPNVVMPSRPPAASKTGPPSSVCASHFLIEQKAAFAAFFPLCPFPGTPLHERLQANNRLFFEDWWLHRRELGEKINLVGIKYPDGQTPGYVLSRQALRGFYSYPSITRRFLPPRKNTFFSFLANVNINHRLRSSALDVL